MSPNHKLAARLYFNSIKVQLEHVSETKAEALPLFQFHKGTIRTQGEDITRIVHLNFNSIKVQLERERTMLPIYLCQFQFHKGTIRTCGHHESDFAKRISIP